MPPRIAARSRAGASAFRAQAMRNLESICQAGYSGSLHSWVEQIPISVTFRKPSLSLLPRILSVPPIAKIHY